MPGGLLNIISYGNQNVILNGNPSKTFFKYVYSKYTNFGLQHFRIDFNGLRTLKLNEESKFTFKMPRYAELLLDTYLVLNLPDIWSPIMPPTQIGDVWKPYEFHWIDDIGTNIIKEVTISIGGQIIQRFSGEYIKNTVERDFTETKKQQFNKMTGNIIEINNPSIAYNRYKKYPNSYFNSENNSLSEPSIRGRKIYVPIPFWFSTSTKMALPIVSLQYSEVQIDITLRAVRELFVINDVTLLGSEFTHNKIQPNFSIEKHSMYRFLQPPTDVTLNSINYNISTTIWDADINLLSTYCFLTGEEAKVFALNEQKYLIQDIKEDEYLNTTGTKKIKLNTTGLVSSWMFYFRRSDAYLRNQWSNYSNWPYLNVLPFNVIRAPKGGGIQFDELPLIGPACNYIDIAGNTTNNNIYINPYATIDNDNEILSRMSILFDGQFREIDFDSGIFNYIEKYKMSKGSSNNGLYTYNYTLDTNREELQPSGAINLSRFKTIELGITTITPPIDTTSRNTVICDSEGQFIGVTPRDILYTHTFDMYIIEERYNILRFIGGNAGLVYAR